MEELTKNSGEGIYGIVYKDKVVYVGQSKNMYKRSVQHKQALRNEKHHNFILQRIYDKNKVDFKFVIIEFGFKLLSRLSHLMVCVISLHYI